jgi:hypothetical protein
MVYKRSAKTGWLVLLFAAAYMGVLVYGAVPIRIHAVGGDTFQLQQVSWGRLAAMAVGLGVIALGAVMIIRTARHPIVVEPEGITDTAVLRDRVPWSVVKDIALDGSEQAGYRLVLTLAGATAATLMRVELDGLDRSPSAVFGEVFDVWRAATGRDQRPTGDV